jgi:hypothetical protein
MEFTTSIREKEKCIVENGYKYILVYFWHIPLLKLLNEGVVQINYARQKLEI